MSASEMVPSLMFMTFGVVIVAAVGYLIFFMRKRSNREAFKRGHDIDENLGEK